VAVTLSPHALCTLEELKDWLNIASGETSKDDILTSSINRATSLMESKGCSDRRLKKRAYVNDPLSIEPDHTVDGMIELKEAPVHSVEAVYFDGTLLGAADYTVDPAGFVHLEMDPAADQLAKWEGRQIFRVDYTAGYDAILNPSEWNALNGIAVEFAAHLYHRSTKSGEARQGIAAKSSGHVSTSYADSKMIPDSILDACEPFKRQRIKPLRMI